MTIISHRSMAWVRHLAVSLTQFFTVDEVVTGNQNVAGVWDESGCAYPRRSRRLNTSIELRRVTKAHGDMSVGDEKSAEVIVPLRGRTESWQASATAGCRKSSIGKSTQHRRHGGCRAASSAERKGRVGALIDKRTTEDSYTNTTRGALPGNRRMPNGTYGGVRGRLPPRRGQPPTRLVCAACTTTWW